MSPDLGGDALVCKFLEGSGHRFRPHSSASIDRLPPIRNLTTIEFTSIFDTTSTTRCPLEYQFECYLNATNNIKSSATKFLILLPSVVMLPPCYLPTSTLMLLAVQNLPRANLDLPNATFATFTGNATSFQLFSFWYHTIFRLLYRYLTLLYLPNATYLLLYIYLRLF